MAVDDICKNVKGTRDQTIIAVDAEDVVPVRMDEASSPGGEQASVLLVNQENRGLLVNETSNHFGSRIRRAIVHDDDLNIISSLAQYGIKTFCDIPVNVISRNDN